MDLSVSGMEEPRPGLLLWLLGRHQVEELPHCPPPPRTLIVDRGTETEPPCTRPASRTVSGSVSGPLHWRCRPRRLQRRSGIPKPWPSLRGGPVDAHVHLIRACQGPVRTLQRSRACVRQHGLNPTGAGSLPVGLGSPSPCHLRAGPQDTAGLGSKPWEEARPAPGQPGRQGKPSCHPAVMLRLHRQGRGSHTGQSVRFTLSPGSDANLFPAHPQTHPGLEFNQIPGHHEGPSKAAH